MTICSYCDEGYFKDLTELEIIKGGIANDVKCDHCQGSALCGLENCECIEDMDECPYDNCDE